MLLALLASGCASIVKSSYQPLVAVANPANSKIELISNKKTIKTSTGVLAFPLNKKDVHRHPYALKVSAPGYAAQEITIDTGLSGWYIWGNILVGGLIGWAAVDPATGAMRSVEASNGQEVDELYVGLKKLGFKDALKGAEASSQPLKPSAQSVNKEGLK